MVTFFLPTSSTQEENPFSKMSFFSVQPTAFNNGAGSSRPICDEPTVFVKDPVRPFYMEFQIFSFYLTVKSLRKISIAFAEPITWLKNFQSTRNKQNNTVSELDN